MKYKLFERVDSECSASPYVFDSNDTWMTTDEVIQTYWDYSLKNVRITVNEMAVVLSESDTGKILAVALNDNEDATCSDAEDYCRDYENLNYTR